MHGYYSTVMFYLIGSYYHERSTRIVYYYRGTVERAQIFTVAFSVDLLGNSSIPPFVSFFSELNIIGALFMFNEALVLVIGVYFIVAFYYGVYMLCHLLRGQGRVVFLIHRVALVGLLVGLNSFVIGASV